MKIVGKARMLVVLGVVAAGCGGSAKPQVKQCLLNSDCAAPLVCGQGYCVGQCVTGRDCALGQDCIILPVGKVCQAPEKKTCAYKSDCDPLFCGVDLQCRNQCQTDGDCPKGDKCAIGTAGTMLCVDPVNDAQSYDATTNQIRPAPDGGVSTGGHAAGGASGNGGASATAGASGAGGMGAKGGAGGNAGGGGGFGGAGGSAGAERDGGTSDANPSPDAGPPAKWRLWVGEKSTGHVYGYADSQLQTTYGNDPAVDLALQNLPSGAAVYQVAIDPTGNLWIGLSAAISDAYIFKVDKSTLAATGLRPVAPSAVMHVAAGLAFTMTFDSTGALWINEPGTPASIAARFDASTLAQLTSTPTSPSPNCLITARAGSGPLALDPSGNLFISLAPHSANYFPLGRYDSAQITGAGTISDSPALITPPLGELSDLLQYWSFLLTPLGLNVANGGLVRYSTADIMQSGSPTTFTAEAKFTFNNVSGFSAAWEAMDPDNNLFLSGGQNRIIKISAADQSQSGTVAVTPAATVRAPTSNPSALFTGLAIR